MVKRLSRGLDRDPVIPVPFGPITVGAIPLTGDCLLIGWAVKESTGTASCSFDIFDGIDATGTRVAPVTLSPGQSVRDWTTAPGIDLKVGVFIRVNSGQVEGTLWLRDA